MADNFQADTATLLDKLRAALLIRAERPEGLPDFIDHASRLEAVGLPRCEPAAVCPLYPSLDDPLCGGFAPWPQALQPFITGVADLIADAACDDIGDLKGGTGVNHIKLVHMFGAEAVPLLDAVLSDAVASSYRHHVRFDVTRWPVDADGEEIEGAEPERRIAPIDTDDDWFAEEGFVRCEAGDEHATEIVQFDLDDDLMDALRAFCAKRGKAARAALRGETAHD